MIFWVSFQYHKSGFLFAPLDWIQTKANAPNLNHWNAYHLHPLDWIQTTGTPTICPVGLDTDQSKRPHWNAYYLHPLDWIQTKATPTICPVGLDTDQSKHPEPQPLEHLPFAHAGLIQTTGTPTLERLPFALLDWIQTKATPTICPTIVKR